MSAVELRIKRIQNSKMFREGEEFTVPIMSSQLFGDTIEEVEYALDKMADQGLLSRRSDSRHTRHYSRKPTDIMRIDWRVDHSVHQMVDELMRGW